jgi:hypothetical protein
VVVWETTQSPPRRQTNRVSRRRRLLIAEQRLLTDLFLTFPFAKSSV